MSHRLLNHAAFLDDDSPAAEEDPNRAVQSTTGPATRHPSGDDSDQKRSFAEGLERMKQLSINDSHLSASRASSTTVAASEKRDPGINRNLTKATSLLNSSGLGDSTKADMMSHETGRLASGSNTRRPSLVAAFAPAEETLAERHEKQLKALSSSILPILVKQAKAPMMVVPLNAWLKLERMPRSSDNVSRLVVKSSVTSADPSRSPSGSNVGPLSRTVVKAAEDDYVVFVSHRWWNNQLPDDDENSKYEIVTKALDRMITDDNLDPARIVIWVDFACIDQDDAELQAKGIASLISYAACSDAVVIPVQDERQAIAAFTDAEHPADLANYGERAWCRLETYIFMCVGELTQRPIGCYGYGKAFAKDESKGIMNRISAMMFKSAEKVPEYTLKLLSSTVTDTDLIEKMMLERKNSLKLPSLSNSTKSSETVGTDDTLDNMPIVRSRARSLGSFGHGKKGANGSRRERRSTTLASISTSIGIGAATRVGPSALEVQGASFAESQLPSSGSLTVETDREVIRNIQESVMKTYAHYAILSQCTLAQLLDEDANGQDNVIFAVRGKQIRSTDLELLGTQLKLMSFAPRIMHVDLRRNLIQGGRTRKRTEDGSSDSSGEGEECGQQLQDFLHTLFGFAKNLGVLRLDENPLLCSTGISVLAPCLEHAPQLKEIGLSHCCLSNDSVIYLYRNKMPSELKRIDMSNNLLTDKVIRAVAKLYKKNKRQQLEIELEGNAISKTAYASLVGKLSFDVDTN